MTEKCALANPECTTHRGFRQSSPWAKPNQNSGGRYRTPKSLSQDSISSPTSLGVTSTCGRTTLKEVGMNASWFWQQVADDRGRGELYLLRVPGNVSKRLLTRERNKLRETVLPLLDERTQ